MVTAASRYAPASRFCEAQKRSTCRAEGREARWQQSGGGCGRVQWAGWDGAWTSRGFVVPEAADPDVARSAVLRLEICQEPLDRVEHVSQSSARPRVGEEGRGFADHLRGDLGAISCQHERLGQREACRLGQLAHAHHGSWRSSGARAPAQPAAGLVLRSFLLAQVGHELVEHPVLAVEGAQTAECGAAPAPLGRAQPLRVRLHGERNVLLSGS